MPITSWIRDLFGIQKDMYETKKTRVEIEKIEDEKREQLITPATLEDVKKYDPKNLRLIHNIETPVKGILLTIILFVSLIGIFKIIFPNMLHQLKEKIEVLLGGDER